MGGELASFDVIAMGNVGGLSRFERERNWRWKVGGKFLTSQKRFQSVGIRHHVLNLEGLGNFPAGNL